MVAMAPPGTPERALRVRDVIIGYVSTQNEAILCGDAALRRYDDSATHETRVAIRRLRSTLRVFAAALDPERAENLEGELQWYAHLLGAVRDRQVLRARLEASLNSLTDDLVAGIRDDLLERIDTELHLEQAEHWDSLQAALSGDRYANLLAELDAWVSELPVAPGADEPASTMKKAVGRAERAVPRKLRLARTTADLTLLHDARKAAKRARYAAEAAAPVLGDKNVATLTRRYRKLQELLGEHQDSVLSAEFLRRLAQRSDAEYSAFAFALGMLYEREIQAGARAEREAIRRANRHG
jgi:CHAD domain-containing protein